MKQRQQTLTIERFIDDYKNGNIILNIDYQRNYVWKEQKIKSELIRSVINDLPIGSILLWSTKSDQGFNVSEVIDGQQRMITIKKFVDGEFTLDQSITQKVINDNIGLLRRYALESDHASAKLIEGSIKRLGYNQMPKFMQRLISVYNLNIIELFETSLDEIKEYFSVVQNQEKLKAGELIHALPDNVVIETFPVSLASDLSEILNFNNERMDVLKQLNMVVALNAGKIRMGVADKQIVDVAEKLTADSIDENVQKMFDSLAKEIHETENMHFKDKFTVFGLKLLLLSYLFANDEFKKINLNQKRMIISQITKFAGYFNSNDLSLKEKNIPQVLKADIEHIWKLSKTTHSKSDIQDIFGKNFNHVASILLNSN